MTARNGLKAAKDLWVYEGREVNAVSEEYLDALTRYNDVIKQESERKKLKKAADEGEDLVSLDCFWRDGLVAAVRGRSDKLLTKEELTKVMKWKLARGKFRPLLKNLEMNSESTIEQCTRAAFSRADSGDIDGALQELCELKSVGPATASAVLAPFYPSEAPFMDDVPLMLIQENPKYSVKEYQELRKELKRVAEELGRGLTAEDVGRALFVVALTSALEASSEPQKKKQKKV